MSIMDDIDREIHNQQIINLLGDFIQYTKDHYVSQEDQDAVLRFIIFLIERGFSND